MTALSWIAAIFGTVLAIAAIGMAYILVQVRMRPRDLTDDEIWSPEDWP